MRRRAFVAGAAGLGTALLAGCSGDGGSGGGGDGDGGGGGDGDGGGGGGDGGSGTFQLLISDQPAAIEDFDSLDVTLSTARVFRADEDEEITPAAVTPAEETASTTDEATTEATETTAEENDEAAETEDGEAESQGFVEFDLGGVTVDLTQVVGDRAVSVLKAELEAGRYSGIELQVSSAEGVVDGKTVDVKVPSNRLRIIRPFEVGADEELSFVFDINVIKKGPKGGYNLLPVIGQSGVAGEDVEVEVVDTEGGGGDGDATETSAGTETKDGGSAAGDKADNAGN